MAESAITFVVQSLSDLLGQKAEFLIGVREQVEWLRDELRRMQCFLKDAEAKQEEDQRVHNWVTEIRNAAYDAEDIVDTFILKIESRRRHGFIKRYAHIFKELLILRKVGKEIEAFRARISDISKSCETYGIKSIREKTSSISRERLRQLRRSSPRGVDKDIVGMKKDVTQLVARLLKKENHLTVISLVGMGVIGKTTLAKKVFNHSDVRCHFDCLAWIYVSQEYRLKDLLFGIIKEVIRPTKELLEMMDNLQEEELEKMLYEHLQEKHYLVVLDDIWTTEAWDLLKRAFPDMDNGSKVMLTTRNRDVALHADPRTAPYELCLLGKEESWELFLRKAFLDGTGGNCPQELEDIGRRIVKKCNGLPLAIIVAGGLLSRTSLLSEWERILTNIDSHFAKGQNGVLSILALSYIDLPHYLKSCFLHLSLFPEDFVISARKIFQLWIAEGLIPQREERMEVIAEDYLNELIDRNMVQVVRTSASKRVKQCRIHDVTRDLSIFKAKEEIFMEIRGKIELPPSIKSRHQSVHFNFNRYFASKPSIPGLRSLLLFHPYDPTDSMKFLYLDTICGSFKLLRVLNLENMQIGYLQSEIGRLINLRYLDLKNTGINQLPSSMRYLKSLQTLDISGNVSLRKIPNMICKMKNLRHLYMNALTCTGKLRIDNLENLQTLSWIHIDNWKVKKSGNLANLRKLGVAVYSGSDLKRFFNSIAELERLVSLQLVPVDTDIHLLPSLSGIYLLSSVTKLSLGGRIRMLPPSHEFPPNIAQLTLHRSFLCVNPMGVLKQLPKLSILRLRKQSYTENQMTIYAGGFPLLSFIELEGLEGLENLTIQDGAMPRLRQFRISSCRGIEYLPAGIMSATTLQELEICRMTSAFVSRLRGKDSYKVEHIPSIKFT
ncbi:hypothetical protein Ddye_013769 [Dipteronia dyeriana]|uniref:Disease resistance protein At1g50180 n=1 Tax=Dipteronia dyeriana TaxID=168575 RepID=A0AAD9X706_9ROSI|nr:hypothetical protein Ddye_013769 [Dipteronia dyeriana]